MKVMCPNCAEKADTYCVDCKKPLCRFCAVLLHHPSTKGEKHSLEEIAQVQGVKILTPILLDILLIFSALMLMSGPGITAQYFDGSSYCPAVSRGRRWLAQTDANLFFYYKAHLSKYCDWEDSYWRFFVDAWVRGILTNTDGWLLLLSELVRAFIFEEFFRLLVTPFVAVAYAIVASILRFVEWVIFRIIYTELEGEQHKATKFFKRVENVIKKLSFAENLPIKDKKKPPPLTLPRKRPMTDYVEGTKYWYDRQTRLLSFYRVQAMTACRFLLRGTLKAAFVLRVCCILFGNSLALEWVQRAGLGELGSKHVSWFAESSGLNEELLREGAYISDTKYSDWLVGQGLQQALKHVPLIGILSQDLGQSLAGGAIALKPTAQRFFQDWLLIPMVILLPPPILFHFVLKRQKKAFAADWKKKTGKAMWGGLSRATSFGGEWQKLRFSPERKPAGA